MKEEDILLKKLGKENSFKVPDGYFENLTSEVMNKLPEKEKVVFKEEPVSTWTRLKPLLYLAAMFVGAALIIRVASTDHKPAAIDEVAVTEVDTEVVSDEMLDGLFCCVALCLFFGLLTDVISIYPGRSSGQNKRNSLPNRQD